MDPETGKTERLRQLWSRFAWGEQLRGEEEKELLGAFESEPGFRDEVVEDALLDGSLRAMGSSRDDGDPVVRAFLEGLAAKRDETGVVDKFKEQLAAERGRAGVQGRADRNGPKTRRRKIHVGSASRAMLSWKVGLAAAGVFAVAILFLAKFPSGPVTSEGKGIARPARSEGPAEARRAGQQQGIENEREPRPVQPRGESRDREKLAELKEGERELEKVAAEFRAKIEAAQKQKREAAGPDGKEPLPQASLQEKPSQSKPGTIAAVATVERAHGAVLTTGEAQTPLRGGEEIGAGQGLKVEAGGVAVLVYADKTRLELLAQTQVTDLQAEGGKRLHLARGTLRAVVTKQPKDQPMVVSTPYGEATVLGTTLRIVVDVDEGKATRLEVENGKVRLKNLAGNALEVVSGHYAVAATGVALAAKPLPDKEETVVLRYDFEDGQRPGALEPEDEGDVVSGGPPRGASRFSVKGTERKPLGSRWGPYVTFQTWHDALVYQEGLVLRFRYHTRGKGIWLQIWNSTASQNYTREVSGFVQDQWGQAEVPFEDLAGLVDKTRRMRPGDLLNGVQIGTAKGDGPLYLDDVEFVRVIARRR